PPPSGLSAPLSIIYPPPSPISNASSRLRPQRRPRADDHGAQPELPASDRVRAVAAARRQGEGADLPVPARRGGRAERARAPRRRRVLPTAPDHRDRTAGADGGSGRGDRPGWVLRIASVARAPQAVVGSRNARA